MAHRGCSEGEETELLWVHGSLALPHGMNKWDESGFDHVEQFTTLQTDAEASLRQFHFEPRECVDSKGSRALSKAEQRRLTQAQGIWLRTAAEVKTTKRTLSDFS